VRWDAVQQLMVMKLQELQCNAAATELDGLLIEATAAVLGQGGDPAIRADMLRLPSENYLVELASHAGGADVQAIHSGREHLRTLLATALRETWQNTFEAERVAESYLANGEQIGRRALANVALDYLASADADGVALAMTHYRDADNLSNRLAALRAVLREGNEALAEELLADFYSRFSAEALAMNHWLQVQAESTGGDAVARVRRLMQHPAYDARNPNKIRALIGTFANANIVRFHREDGEGYRLLGSVIEELNERNPQIASRLLTPLTRWRNFPAGGAQMRGELERLAALPSLSRDVYEIVSKSLSE
jgi:aminopeptidase N